MKTDQVEQIEILVSYIYSEYYDIINENFTGLAEVFSHLLAESIAVNSLEKQVATNYLKQTIDKSIHAIILFKSFQNLTKDPLIESSVRYYLSAAHPALAGIAKQFPINTNPIHRWWRRWRAAIARQLPWF